MKTDSSTENRRYTKYLEFLYVYRKIYFPKPGIEYGLMRANYPNLRPCGCGRRTHVVLQKFLSIRCR